MPESRTRTERKLPRSAFKPGQSGNPGGRPKKTQEEKDALVMIRSLAPKAVERLEEILDNPKVNTRDLLRAIEIVFDRAFGKEDYNRADNGLLLSLMEMERRATNG